MPWLDGQDMQPPDLWPEGYARRQPGPRPLGMYGYPLYVEYGTTLAQRAAYARTAAGQWQQLRRAVGILGRNAHHAIAPLLPRAMRPCRCRRWYRLTHTHVPGCQRRPGSVR